MDADQLTRKGAQFNGALKTRWSRFRDQHVVQCEGSDDQVIDQAHYGMATKKRAPEEGRPAASAVDAGHHRATVRVSHVQAAIPQGPGQDGDFLDEMLQTNLVHWCFFFTKSAASCWDR